MLFEEWIHKGEGAIMVKVSSTEPPLVCLSPHMMLSNIQSHGVTVTDTEVYPF